MQTAATNVAHIIYTHGLKKVKNSDVGQLSDFNLKVSICGRHIC